ncbi:MAG: hypothetical protein KA137_12085, partial [Halioglobus sp.]|nr:hypothetical protein [Halioglobus sp.]
MKFIGCFNKEKSDNRPLLVQEKPGFRLGIATDTKAAGSHAAHVAKEHYEAWLRGDESSADTPFKRDYFAIAVGGGNTVKFEYKALLKNHLDDINWLDHVRFFFLEESCQEENWGSAREALESTFIRPLAKALIAAHGKDVIAQRLGLVRSASGRAIAQRIVELMTFP